MPKFKFNIFYMISILCMFLLIYYLWFFYLPLFEGSLEYASAQNLVIMTTLALFVAILLTIIQMTRKTEPS